MRKDEIVERYEKDFERDSQQCSPLHKTYREDKEFFLLDKQWSDTEKQARNPKGQPPRPTLTVNRSRQFLMQVINDHKQARMGIRVTPAGGDEDVKLAQVRQGIIRAIERNNGGRGAYNQAKEDQVGAGFGAWRLYADYLGPDSFEQEPKFLPIYDCTNLFWPILDCREPDYSDMDNGIVREHYSEAAFKAKLKMNPEDFLTSDANPIGAWGTGKAPCVSEYYFREEIDDVLVKDVTGKTHFLTLLEKKLKEAEDKGQIINLDDFLAVDEDGKRIERETTRCRVWWAKLAGRSVIGKPIELPGQYIPIFIANGRKIVLDGRIELYSLGRPVKDTQRSHNYACSAELERLSLSPKVPFMVAEESIPKGEENKWATINTGNHPFVKFRAFDARGNAIPPPIRTSPVQSDPGFLNLKMSTIDEMKAVLGMYDASLGQKSNETSGVAINARQREGDNATFDFADNMAIAIRHCGVVLNEWIPTYIDTARQVRMIGEDESEKVVTVNAEAKDENGQPYHYPMTEGKFDIAVDTGPSASTKRQETVQAMQEFYKAYPAAASVTGHLFAKEQDWQFKEEFSDILKRLSNLQFPGVVEAGQGQQQDPRQLQAALQQMQAQVQRMQQALQTLGPENERLKIENQAIKADRALEAQRVQIEAFKAQVDARAKGVDMSVKQGQMALKADQQQHDQRIDNAQIVHQVHQDRTQDARDAQAQAHSQEQDRTSTVLQAQAQAHGQQQDREKLGLEGRKLDQAKTAGRTGGKPGSSSQGRKA